MTTADQRSALGALDAGRPVVARLDPVRHPEENAADLIELWTSIETALRSLTGGSMASGQDLIRELRQRGMISLDQAHAFLELLAVRERVDRTDYQPTTGDIQVARDAYAALDHGLRAPTPAAAAVPAAATASGTPPTILMPDAPPSVAPASDREPASAPVSARRSRARWLGAFLILIAAILVAGGVYWYTGNSGVPSDLAKAIAEYQGGQTEAARADFAAAARKHPNMALPHLYLARLAREEGDFTTAGNELKTAVQLEPGSAAALRELGAFFLARGTHFANQGRPDLATADYDAARRNYVKSLTIDPSDQSAQGYLGCTLTRLGRAQEAASWFTRAGQGPWSACAAPTAPATGTSPVAP